jgi:hypothetical protein
MFRVRGEKCDTCLYAIKYPKSTRDRILGDVAANDGYVQCHNHDRAARVCCRGYWDAVGEDGESVVQMALRFERMGMDVVEYVQPNQYPPSDDDDEEE